MKKLIEKIKGDHLAFLPLIVLFIAPLWLPSVREAHVLCLRWLLHLKGDTYVQGNPPGRVVYTVPNVQFTDTQTQ